jgi:hypothetical protein
MHGTALVHRLLLVRSVLAVRSVGGRVCTGMRAKGEEEKGGEGCKCGWMHAAA